MKKIVIVEGDSRFAQELKEAFEEDGEFSVCAVCTDGNQGINAIAVQQPDVVLADTTLAGEDGFGVLKAVKEKTSGCTAFIISNFSDDNIVSKAICGGANYYFVKPIAASTVCKRIKEVLSENVAKHLIANGKRRVTSLDEKISNVFITIGVPPHVMGYQYLREAIKMTVAEQSLINNITKRLYPEIAVKFNTTASKVERAIRHAIEVAWNRGRIDAINSVFGTKIYIGTDRPTNSEFIALIADKFILEELT